MLVTGSAFALGAVFVHPFARLFLTAHRAEMEVRQYAQSLFLSRELFATKNRQAVLLLISIFEKQIIVLPDKGTSKRLSPKEIQEIIARMTPSLAAGRVSCALADGLEGLVKNLAGTAKDTSRENEISDEIIEEKGI
jgi:putative membrane protein